MFTTVELPQTPKTQTVKPFDDTWQAWIAKGLARERRGYVSRIRAVKWVSMAALLGAASIGPHFSPLLDHAIKFVVSAGALALTFESFRARRHGLTLMFGVLALAYNPIAPLISFVVDWERIVAGAAALPYAMALRERPRARRAITKGVVVSISTLTAFLVLGAIPAAALAADLSRYRGFQLGSDLAAVAKQAGATPANATELHKRPALIQELVWNAQPLGSSSRTEPVKQVTLRLFNGELFRIVVEYDRYETEGLTVEDFVGAISASYGPPSKPPTISTSGQSSSGDREDPVARWEDDQYRIDLIHASYGPGFRLVGTLRRLEAPAHAAAMEAKRLDQQEAPQRDAARAAKEGAEDRAKLDKARLLNKPRFRL